MSKWAGIFLIIIFFVGGILLGNQYGRRDVVNSRPPEIIGDLGKPAVTSSETRYKIESLLVSGSGGVYGSLALFRVDSSAEGILHLNKIPSPNSSDGVIRKSDTPLKVFLFSADNKPVTELTSFFDTGSAQDIRIDIAELKNSYYIAVFYEGSSEPVLISERVK